MAQKLVERQNFDTGKGADSRRPAGQDLASENDGCRTRRGRAIVGSHERNSALDRLTGRIQAAQPDSQRAVGRPEREKHQGELEEDPRMTREVEPEPSAGQRTEREQVIEQIQLEPRRESDRRSLVVRWEKLELGPIAVINAPPAHWRWKLETSHIAPTGPLDPMAILPHTDSAAEVAQDRGDRRGPARVLVAGTERRLDLIDPAEVGRKLGDQGRRDRGRRADARTDQELPASGLIVESPDAGDELARVGQVEIMRPTSRQSSATR